MDIRELLKRPFPLGLTLLALFICLPSYLVEPAIGERRKRLLRRKKKEDKTMAWSVLQYRNESYSNRCLGFVRVRDTERETNIEGKTLERNAYWSWGIGKSSALRKKVAKMAFRSAALPRPFGNS